MAGTPPRVPRLATYSVCMLCSNDGDTVKASVESVLGLSKFRQVEVVVADNMSRDGSREGLLRLKDAGLIRLVERRCSRGEGRELAFEASTGDYVLSHMDCDDIFNPTGLDSLIAKYHAGFEGTALMTKKRGSKEASNITIAPRGLLQQVGGWRPLNWGEDWDLWARLAGTGRYRFLPYPAEDPPHARIRVRSERYAGATHGFFVRVRNYSDAVRTGRRVFSKGESTSKAQRLALAFAKAKVALRSNSLPPVPDPDFAEDIGG